MHVASMLGHKFTVVDLAENHNMYYYDLVKEHGFEQRCASIRNINNPLPRPPDMGQSAVHLAKNQAQRGEKSEVVEAAVREAIAGIEEDAADVITFGCSALFWLQPILQKRLDEMGWEVPVLEGYGCAITLAKAVVDLGVSASGLVCPSAHPKKIRPRKLF
jgi:Asp/Glu/hydantoin racemase